MGLQEKRESICTKADETECVHGIQGMLTYPIVAAFITDFSTPPAAETCAPIFQGISRRGRNCVLSEIASVTFLFPLRLGGVPGATPSSALTKPVKNKGFA